MSIYIELEIVYKRFYSSESCQQGVYRCVWQQVWSPFGRMHRELLINLLWSNYVTGKTSLVERACSVGTCCMLSKDTFRHVTCHVQNCAMWWKILKIVYFPFLYLLQILNIM